MCRGEDETGSCQSKRKEDPDADPLEVREGEHMRFQMQNRSMMVHPMHLHGHFFQIENSIGRGSFKDTRWSSRTWVR